MSSIGNVEMRNCQIDGAQHRTRPRQDQVSDYSGLGTR